MRKKTIGFFVLASCVITLLLWYCGPSIRAYALNLPEDKGVVMSRFGLTDEDYICGGGTSLSWCGSYYRLGYGRMLLLIIENAEAGSNVVSHTVVSASVKYWR